MKIFTW